MDRLSSEFLLVFWFLTFVCIYGKHQAFTVFTPSCEVAVMVRRGTVWKAVPHQRLSVDCAVRHCGEPLQVTWCKRLDIHTCVQLNDTKSIEIIQKDKPAKDKLISHLLFKRISISDDGLYRCGIKGYENVVISHLINISVSDTHQGADNSHNNANDSPKIIGDKAANVSWAPYICICIGIGLLVFSLIAIAHLSSHGCERMLTNNQTKEQEMSTRTLPDIPKWSMPPTPGVQRDLSRERPHADAGTSRSTLPVEGGQEKPVGVTYTKINHQRSGESARGQQATTQHDKHSDCAALSIS